MSRIKSYKQIMKKNSIDSKKAPEGFHYMPDGSLMKNQDMKEISWKDYIPLITVFGYILFGSYLLTHFFVPGGIELINENFWMEWMINLMGVWFIIFSLFKTIDLQGFADGYSTYDIIAKRFNIWGKLYPFIELLLGVLYLARWQLFFTNIATILVLGVATIGVIQSIIKKSKIQCACLGTVLKVPLTKVTLFEGLFMIFMAAIMLLL